MTEIPFTAAVPVGRSKQDVGLIHNHASDGWKPSQKTMT